MNRLLRLFLASALVMGGFSIGSTSSAEQYQNIAPEFRCHYKLKKRSFCERRPNFALRRGICNPPPTMLGHIEWCREDVTITERDDCGNYETYEAVVITYREVYENGAWGDKFKRTVRKEPTLITPPVIYK
ncbi:MAG: hypothetical protein AAGA96_16605 [Verrucomicrobiota bacterium]